MAAGLGLLALLGGCAAGPPVVSDAPKAAGFLLGVWHGLILPITFVVSLFDPHVGVYDIHNGGHLHDLGFVLAAGGLALPGRFSRRGGRSIH